MKKSGGLGRIQLKYGQSYPEHQVIVSVRETCRTEGNIEQDKPTCSAKSWSRRTVGKVKSLLTPWPLPLKGLRRGSAQELDLPGPAHIDHEKQEPIPNHFTSWERLVHFSQDSLGTWELHGAGKEQGRGMQWGRLGHRKHMGPGPIPYGGWKKRL